jgi:FkbM family methyltransferase
LKSGYEVYAFEPFTPVFEKLQNRLGKCTEFHSYNIAIGSDDTTMNLHLATDLSGSGLYKDTTLYSSLMPHSMPEDMVFANTIRVPVRSLESLHRAQEIPMEIGLVKIDTEGFDLEVIRGMGEHRYSIIMAEFWDAKMEFGKSGALNRLNELVEEMRQRNYHWHIVVYHVWGSDGAAYYSNYAQSVDKSWGNVFFFQDYKVFAQALQWCSATLPATYFAPHR